MCPSCDYCTSTVTVQHHETVQFCHCIVCVMRVLKLGCCSQTLLGCMQDMPDNLSCDMSRVRFCLINMGCAICVPFCCLLSAIYANSIVYICSFCENLCILEPGPV
jgi:hypothetical protein